MYAQHAACDRVAWRLAGGGRKSMIHDKAGRSEDNSMNTDTPDQSGQSSTPKQKLRDSSKFHAPGEI